MTVTESIGLTHETALFKATLLYWAYPSLESVHKIEVTERGDIFGVDGVAAISAVGVVAALEAFVMEVAVVTIA
jgi:hypothetical protein